MEFIIIIFFSLILSVLEKRFELFGQRLRELLPKYIFCYSSLILLQLFKFILLDQLISKVPRCTFAASSAAHLQDRQCDKQRCLLQWMSFIEDFDRLFKLQVIDLGLVLVLELRVLLKWKLFLLLDILWFFSINADVLFYEQVLVHRGKPIRLFLFVWIRFKSRIHVLMNWWKMRCKID